VLLEHAPHAPPPLPVRRLLLAKLIRLERALLQLRALVRWCNA
jgi:hypothetical protein